MISNCADSKELLRGWEAQYARSQFPIEVDFRSAAGPSVKTERFTHLIHPYPAKVIPQIPGIMLDADLLGRPPRLVADPFSGSGTVLLEGAIRGLATVGADTNPLARLIARVKLRRIEPELLVAEAVRIRSLSSKLPPIDPPRVANIDLWYTPRIVTELNRIRTAIHALDDGPIADFFRVCLSVCARKLSNADPRLSVPVRINLARRERYGRHYEQLRKVHEALIVVDVEKAFFDIVNRNIARIATIPQDILDFSILNDVLDFGKEEYKESVDMIITSPPYLGAQKYIRSCGLNMYWLDLAGPGDLRKIDGRTVGREQFKLAERKTVAPVGITQADMLLDEVGGINPLRAHIGRTYLHEMRRSLEAMFSALKPDGALVLVIGANSLCGRNFDTPAYVEQLAHKVGFRTRFKLIDTIRSRGLMTRRNSTAGIISSEAVLCLRK